MMHHSKNNETLIFLVLSICGGPSNSSVASTCSLHVSYKIVAPEEGLLTPAAVEGLVPRMLIQVPLQIYSC